MFARAFVQNDATNALIFALVIVTLGLGFWISRSRIALYGTGWYFLSIVPSVLLLAPAYVLGSPRLMVLASVGASLFWAAVVARLSSMKRFRWVAAVGVLSVICISGIFFMERAYDFLRMGDYIWRLTHLAESLKLTKNDEMLVLNPPDFLAPLAFNRRFLLSAEGATVMMDFLPYSQLLWLNTGQMFPNVKAFASRNNLRPPADRLYVPYQPFVDGQPLFDLLHKTPRLVVTAFDGDLFWPVYVGGPNLPGPDNMLAIFDQIELLQAEAYYSPNNRLVTVRLRWRLPEAVGARPFVHVYCNTDFIGQSDLSPWGGAYPFSGWQPGETQTEIRQVLLHKSPTPDCLRIQLGVYNEANAQRLKLTDVQHTSYPDDLYPVLLTAASQSIIP